MAERNFIISASNVSSCVPSSSFHSCQEPAETKVEMYIHTYIHTCKVCGHLGCQDVPILLAWAADMSGYGLWHIEHGR